MTEIDKKEAIKREYANLVASAGELHYRIIQSQKELDAVVIKIEELNLQYTKLIQEEAEQEDASKTGTE
jgi:hypothetical protein